MTNDTTACNEPVTLYYDYIHARGARVEECLFSSPSTRPSDIRMIDTHKGRRRERDHE